jgi:hypothetical protein
MRLLFEYLFGPQLEKETARYLETLAETNVAASRRQTDALLKSLKGRSEPQITIGCTPWGAPVIVPVSEIVRAHGVVTGTTGSGKTRMGLAVIKALLDSTIESLIAEASNPGGFGALDAKGDLFHGTLFLIAKHLQELQRAHPHAAHELRRRIVIIDFSSRFPMPVMSYNIFARWPGLEADFFAANRADVLMDLLPGSDRLSLGASGVLNKLILLMSEHGVPVTDLGEMVGNERRRSRLVAQCRDRSLAAYFTRQFPQVPKSTLSALLRRIDALFTSDGVRLALGCVSAPNFRQLQDEGKIVVITSFGKTIARGVRRVLQKLVFSDITQSVFSRQKPESPFPWLCDEAQNFFYTESLRDNVTDLLTMSRSFGTFFLFFTQDLQTAVHDPRILRVLNTNTRWCMAMRCDPADCTFLKSALPITGRRFKPHPHPFAEQSLYSPTEERALVHQEIASLPDRQGFIWLKNRSAEAIPVVVADVPIPDGNALMKATSAIRQDATIGGRMSRKQYDQAIAARDKEQSYETPDLSMALTRRYQSTREEREV